MGFNPFKAITDVVGGVSKAIGGIPVIGKVFQEINKLVNEIKQLASQLMSIAMKPLMEIMDDLKILGVIAELARKVLQLANLPFVKEALMLLKVFNPALGMAIDKALQIAKVASVLDHPDPETRLRAINGIGSLLGVDVPVVGDVVKAFDAIAGVNGMQQDLINEVAKLATISVNKNLGQDVKVGFTANLLTGQWGAGATLAPGAAKKGSVLDGSGAPGGIFDAKAVAGDGVFSGSPVSGASPVFKAPPAVFDAPAVDPPRLTPERLDSGSVPMSLRLDHPGPKPA